MNKVLFFCVFLALNLFAAEYQVDSEQDNMVLFISEAPMEQFEGTTSKIEGFVKWNGDNPLNDSDFYFQVDLTDLDTGIGLRNQHMRDNYLHTDKYRYAVYSGKLTAVDTLETGNDFDVKVEGMLNLHGIEKPYVIDGRVTLNDNAMQIQCGFELALSHHNIKIPKMMFVKINEILLMDLNFYLKKIDGA